MSLIPLTSCHQTYALPTLACLPHKAFSSDVGDASGHMPRGQVCVFTRCHLPLPCPFAQPSLQVLQGWFTFPSLLLVADYKASVKYSCPYRPPSFQGLWGWIGPVGFTPVVPKPSRMVGQASELKDSTRGLIPRDSEMI